MLEGIVPGISDFHPTALPSVWVQLPNGYEVMFDFGAYELLYQKYKPLPRKAFRQFLLRVIAGQRAYSRMCAALEAYFKDHVSDSPRFSHYFTALEDAEICILQMHMAVDAIKCTFNDEAAKSLSHNFKNLNDIASRIKHFGGQSKSTVGVHGGLLPLMFETGGLTNGVQAMTFVQQKDILEEFSRWGLEILGPIARTGYAALSGFKPSIEL